MIRTRTLRSAMRVARVRCLSDNYGWLLHCGETGATAAVDTPDAAPLAAALRDRGWRLTHILNTHHHADHVGGNLALRDLYPGVQIVCNAADAARIPGATVTLRDGDSVSVGSLRGVVLETPGHTVGHVCYYFEGGLTVFVGDTLFSLGCGRLFEGSPAQMHASLCRLTSLPAEAEVYCAHEYTENNLAFWLSLFPDDEQLLRFRDKLAGMVDEDGERCTVPTTVGEQVRVNPFLRTDQPDIKRALGMQDATSLEVFTELRARRDNW
ncbi:Hydroxyacylglutathione hydrolase [Diplonema papillatum]|nr:Hydroxyacylglutathione hydrolase [Diplonema papillatum]